MLCAYALLYAHCPAYLCLFLSISVFVERARREGGVSTDMLVVLSQSLNQTTTILESLNQSPRAISPLPVAAEIYAHGIVDE